MIIINFFLSLFLIFGFHFIGEKSLKILNVYSFYNKIINQDLLSIIVGLFISLLLIYPLILYQVISLFYLKFFLIILILYGFFKLFSFIKIYDLKNYFLKIKEKKNLDFIIFNIIIFFYFLISISPITDADSTGYHLFIPKYFINNGIFPIQDFNFQVFLLGIGEVLNLLGLLFDLKIFISLLNFLGILIILSIISKLSQNKFEKYFYFLLVLSCPILIPLTNTAKPQLLFISAISVSFGSLVYLFNFYKKDYNYNIYCILFFIILFGSISYLAKPSFLFGYFFSIIFFLFYIYKNYKKNFLLYSIIIILLLNVLIISPILFWKIDHYSLNSLKSFILPLPNFPGMENFVENLQSYNSNNSLLSYIIPIDKSNLTNTFGVLIFIIPLVFYSNLKNKKIILTIFLLFSCSIMLFSQKSPRFFLEIYFLALFIIVSSDVIFKKIKLFKFMVYMQSIFVSLMILFGIITLFPGQINSKFEDKVFSNYANGYELYKWSNQIIKNDEYFLTSHRSVFFSKGNPMFLEFVYYLSDDYKKNLDISNYHLNKLDKLKPKYILFWGNEVSDKSFKKLNFENCIIDNIASKKDVGHHASRNPFNKNKESYSAAIFTLDQSLNLTECVKLIR